MIWKSTLPQQLLCRSVGHARRATGDLLASLENRFVGAIEDEEGLDGEGEQAQKAIV